MLTAMVQFFAWQIGIVDTTLVVSDTVNIDFRPGGDITFCTVVRMAAPKSARRLVLLTDLYAMPFGSGRANTAGKWLAVPLRRSVVLPVFMATPS